MSRKLLTVAALAAFALPLTTTNAHAQMKFGAAAGLSLPTGTFADAVDAGYHVLGSISVMPPLAPVGFRVEGMFNEFNYKSSLGAPFNGEKSRILAATGNVIVSAPGVMGPYLIGGLGIYRSSSTIRSWRSSSDLGFNAGAGLRFSLTGFSAYAEARYHYISGTGSARFLPISFGLVF